MFHVAAGIVEVANMYGRELQQWKVQGVTSDSKYDLDIVPFDDSQALRKQM